MRRCKWPVSVWVMLSGWPMGLALAQTGTGDPDDPFVLETEFQVPGDGLFVVTAKATDLGTGFWRYEYAVSNVSSQRSARSFSVCFGGRLVDGYGGEIYNSADWIANVADGGVNWATQSYAANPDANALRPGMTYNFRFDAYAPPWIDPTSARIGLFRPGYLEAWWGNTVGPGEICSTDHDHDGTSDCSDYCPDTPFGTCTCQGIGSCCVGCLGPCMDLPRDECVANGGTTNNCGDPQCRNGCPLFDMDNDGHRDLADFAGLQRCFSGLRGVAGFVTPAVACINRLDLDDDHAISLADYRQLFDLGLFGP